VHSLKAYGLFSSLFLRDRKRAARVSADACFRPSFDTNNINLKSGDELFHKSQLVHQFAPGTKVHANLSVSFGHQNLLVGVTSPFSLLLVKGKAPLLPRNCPQMPAHVHALELLQIVECCLVATVLRVCSTVGSSLSIR
jgi:hypothetical protein